MTTKVWISTSDTPESPLITPGPGSPGGAWQLVGGLDRTRETDLWKHAQYYLGLRSGPRAPRWVDFYLDGDPESPWVQANHRNAGATFWLAFDAFGDGSRYLIGCKRAEVLTGMVRRTPEAHPGLLTRPVFVPIRLPQGDTALFDQASK